MSYLDFIGTIICRWVLVSLVAGLAWVILARFFFQKDD